MVKPLETLKGWAESLQEKSLGDYADTVTEELMRLFEAWRQEYPDEQFSACLSEQIGRRANILGALLMTDERLARMIAPRVEKLGHRVLVYGAYSPPLSWTGVTDDRIGTYVDIDPARVGPDGYRAVWPVDDRRIFWPPQSTVSEANIINSKRGGNE